MKKIQKPLIDSVNAIYGENTDEGWYKVSEELAPHYQSIVPDLDDVVDHIDHLVRVAGINHVGIGSDYDGVSKLPMGLEDVSTYPRITQLLLDRGYCRRDIDKIMSGNMMRVIRQVERVSQSQNN